MFNKLFKNILVVAVIVALINATSKVFNVDINTCYNIVIVVLLFDISTRLDEIGIFINEYKDLKNNIE